MIAGFFNTEMLQYFAIPPEYRGTFNLTCFGHNWGINLNLWPNFMASMWERCGFTQQEMMRLPLVFDQRNPAREKELLNRLWPTPARKKPLCLYNLTGISSPFGYTPELMPTIQSFARHLHLVDLGRVKAHRIFDLLGVYDAAVGLITCDTATAHLAHASKVPVIWMSVDGWCGSVPRGNIALHFRYNETPRRLKDVAQVLQAWCDNSRLVPIRDDRPGSVTPAGGGGTILANPALARAAC